MTRVQELVEQVRALSEDERDEFDLLLMKEAESAELSPEWRAEIARRASSTGGASRTWDDLEREYAAMKERKHRSRPAVTPLATA